MVKVKETAKEGRNRKSKAADKKRDVNNGLMGILCRDSNTATNPPRAKLLRRKDSDRDKVEKIRLGNNRHMITCERQLAVEIDRRNDCSSRILILLLGRHRNFTGRSNSGEILEKRMNVSRRKCDVRAQNSKARVGMSINGVFPSGAPFLKSAKSSLGKTRLPT